MDIPLSGDRAAEHDECQSGALGYARQEQGLQFRLTN
jgi:hypothetical protein